MAGHLGVSQISSSQYDMAGSSHDGVTVGEVVIFAIVKSLRRQDHIACSVFLGVAGEPRPRGRTRTPRRDVIRSRRDMTACLCHGDTSRVLILITSYPLLPGAERRSLGSRASSVSRVKQAMSGCRGRWRTEGIFGLK